MREAVTAFGRGECFVERFLDHPRHVETQCLADQHGNVVVVSTRDCSLQRRNQKLVEEAPAPFLTEEQHTELLRASKAILQRGRLRRRRHLRVPRRAGRATSRFLEVNTRLQVEHPVTEEVTGIDLVREQFRIADGESLDYDDPEPHAHSIEFRINGEDAGRGFLPAPGTVTPHASSPQGPGVRWDSGIVEGDTVAGAFDSMIAKLIVTGRTRAAGPRAVPPRPGRARHRRACRPSLPFHRAVVADPAFAPADRTSRSRSTPAGSRPSSTTPSRRMPVGRPTRPRPRSARPSSSRSAASGSRSRCPAGSRSVAAAAAARGEEEGAPALRRRRSPARAASGDSLTAPMQGTIVKIAVEEGATVAAGDLVVVLEAMKMEQPITAHKAGVVSGLTAEVGATVTSGAVLAEIKDAAEG